MRKIRNDLWETRGEKPFPGLTTHAYLWTPPSGDNVLFYSTVTDHDFDEIEELGGIARHYLSHHDEAGPMVQKVAQRFGASLHAGRGDERRIAKVADQVEWLDHREIHGNGVEVIPTPGHTPGSFCFLVKGVGNGQYLFVGDTLFTERDGSWATGNFSFSDPAALKSSLRLLASLRPNLVASSAAPSGVGAHDFSDDSGWEELVRQLAAALDAQ